MSKRKRSPTLTTLSPRKKVIVEPRFKEISEYTLRRIKRNVPSDVNVIRIYTDTGSKAQLGNIPQENKVAIIIGILDYTSASSPLHRNHAIGVYKWGDVLYCMDPWGYSSRTISRTIFKNLKEMTGCKYIRVYSGHNLQLYDPSGVCVGLSSNFLTYMAHRKTHLLKDFSETVRRKLMQYGVNEIAKSLNKKTLAISKSKRSLSRLSRSKRRSPSPMNINLVKIFTSK